MDCLVSVSSEESDFQTSVSPNPNTGDFILHYNLSTAQNISLKITNLTGQVIAEYILSNTIQQIPISLQNQPAGIYLYTITARNSHQTGKIMIIK
jgi:hypothetical protein